MFLRLLLTMILPLAASAQLVIKHQGQVADVVVRRAAYPFQNVDIDGDGVPEHSMGPISTGGWGFLNLITGEQYVTPRAEMWETYLSSWNGVIGKGRSINQAELAKVDYNSDHIYIYDVMTGELVFDWGQHDLYGVAVLARDYDGDGLDDYFFYFQSVSGGGGGGSIPMCYDYVVVGTGAAYLPSTGPTLAIEYTGPDVLLSWASVPEADGYRVLWGAETDSPCFTQVGYTSGTYFLHTGFGDVPKGFYKVLAVSATGVPRGTAGEGRVNR